PSLALLPSFTATPTPAISPLSLHDALPILRDRSWLGRRGQRLLRPLRQPRPRDVDRAVLGRAARPGQRAGRGLRAHRPRHLRQRSEEHTSELQSLTNLVCRLLLAQRQPLNT